MRSAYLLNSKITHSVALLAGIAIGWVSIPVWREALIQWHQEEYGLLVEQCDTAMREQFQARATATNDPSEIAGRNLQAADLGLLVCQDYDLYQKRLLQWGLRESELSRMRLTAIELRSEDLSEVLETHEIRY